MKFFYTYLHVVDHGKIVTENYRQWLVLCRMRAKGQNMAQGYASLDNMDTEYYRLLVEQVKEYAIFMLTPDGFVASWNAGAARITGYSAEEIIGKHFSIFYEPDADGGKAAQELTEAFAKGRYEDYGWRVRRDGTSYWANVILTPLYNNNKEFIGFSKVTRDLTERKHWEEALLSSREEFRTLANSLPHVVWTADNQGFITYWNDSFYKYTGLPETQVSRTKVPDTVHRDDVHKLRGLWREAIMSGQEFEAEFRLKRYDGTYRWHLGRAVPLGNSKGNIFKWIGSATDVHEQKTTADRKDEFIGIAGHELRTPLTNIKAYAQLLEREIDNAETSKAKDYLCKIYVFIDSLNKLISDLLDVSRIQRGKMPFEYSVFDMDGFVKDCVDAHQLSVKSHKITIVNKVGSRVRADKSRLMQVLTNYLTNAIKYSPGKQDIKVIMTLEDGHIKVTVKDHGIGIPSEQVESVFNKFFRAKNMESNIHGLGLGLYISSEIIKLLGGKVGVKSKEGDGSEFWFTLPAYTDEGDRAGGAA
jgi:PAS domain S-box-containing protein